MTVIRIASCAFALAAAVVAVSSVISTRRALRSTQRALREIQARRRTFPWKDGEVTITAPMTEADYEAFKARWQAVYGRTVAACSAYQPPTTAEMTGLCARCGMYDYKHRETAP